MAKNINIPNTITILRFLFTPVFFYFLMTNRVAPALLTFGFVAITDLADGWIARRTKQQTKCGEALDPFADKFMVAFGVVALVRKFDFPIYAIPFFLLRDIISILGSLLYFSKKRGNWKPNIFGKLTTLFQVATIFVYIIDFDYKVHLLATTVAFSAIAGMSYLHRGLIFIFRRDRIVEKHIQYEAGNTADSESTLCEEERKMREVS